MVQPLPPHRVEWAIFAANYGVCWWTNCLSSSKNSKLIQENAQVFMWKFAAHWCYIIHNPSVGRIKAITRVYAWRMCARSVAAQWLNSPEARGQVCLSTRTQNRGFKVSHCKRCKDSNGKEPEHASWWCELFTGSCRSPSNLDHYTVQTH